VPVSHGLASESAQCRSQVSALRQRNPHAAASDRAAAAPRDFALQRNPIVQVRDAAISN